MIVICCLLDVDFGYFDCVWVFDGFCVLNFVVCFYWIALVLRFVFCCIRVWG